MTSVPLAYVLSFIDRWHMPLLFLLAGASTFLALRKRTTREYLGERVKRLLVPFAFGVALLIPPQTFVGAGFNSGYADGFIHYITSGDFLVLEHTRRWRLLRRLPGSAQSGGSCSGCSWLSLLALPLSRLGPQNDKTPNVTAST